MRRLTPVVVALAPLILLSGCDSIPAFSDVFTPKEPALRGDAADGDELGSTQREELRGAFGEDDKPAPAIPGL
jgi:hypothetical protein